MSKPGNRETWHRPEFQGRESELENREEFEKRRGLRSGTINSRFYDYADRRPALVKEVGRVRYYVAAELDRFYDSLKGRGAPRTAEQVLAARVVRRQDAVKGCEEAVKRKQEELEKAQRSLAYHKKRLDDDRAALATERATAR
jgi:hypothetical protein